MIESINLAHQFDCVLQDEVAEAAALERLELFLEFQDKAIDTFGTFGSAGTFGGCFGCLGTAGCCC